MSIQIREVKNRRDFRRFINLPAAIHKNHKSWVPPIYMDDRVFFNSKKNEAFAHSDTILLLAFKGGKAVGRIMGIINRQYNEAQNEKDGRFCFLETYEDFEVAQALIRFVEDWAREKGMNNLVGPLGFSEKDPQGLLIEGYDKPVVIATNCSFPYMVDLVERAGYTKKLDLWVYTMEVPDELPEFYKKIHERALRNNPDFRMIEFNTRKEIKPYIRPVFNLVNEAFKDIYAFALLSEKEMHEFASRYLMIINPRFLKVIENGKHEVIAFILGMPDISEGIKKCRGRLIPFGIFQIFRAQKKAKQLNLLLGAIKKEYRNAGLDTMMGVKMLDDCRKYGIKFIDSHLEMETNIKMHAELGNLGGTVYKKFRIYIKAL
jgi:hypothetical protein